MGKFYIRLLLVLLGMGFCIFFGVDLATRGLEQIQGPIVKAAPDSMGTVRMWPQPADKKQDAKAVGEPQAHDVKSNGSAAKTKKEQEDTEPKAEVTETAGIARIGNKAGDLLQIIAYHGIKLFISLFDLITG
ncbi:hypothetical protein [Paenibacillus piri]|uniref:DUF3679 domain-containing protein n=1 Tax=Paenibacillus piri TaxID=2547395 RepID=A0A4V2ZTH1_9BACL|nr:hypothetical protein [Paenibacillus piri]TDF96764.1 hypothetical protein E1757_16950 [Paenibacillus piri]